MSLRLKAIEKQAPKKGGGGEMWLTQLNDITRDVPKKQSSSMEASNCLVHSLLHYLFGAIGK